ncbi:proline-rich protein 5-like isoform X4 [Bos taurus]|uniref:proline-rich protein 5-like isoform X4 n=1 Tax=Bos taurus TaxID=9913 RepID=UPI0028CB7C03|nr:proline-rich protein 5-like isoform X4 [Bos taurus]XP_059730582.1 proline-rich protein 5-like isoform X4 [Bos taurus]
MTRGFAPSLPVEFPKMGSFRRPRPRFMSSPALSDLPRFQAARQALQLSSNSAWNSVQTAVINVFKGGGLQSNELYALNENIRRLLKSELGSFITDYFQNQLLAKGLLFVEEKIKLCEGSGADHPPDFPAGLPRPGAAEGEAGGLAAASAAPAALVHRPDVAHPAARRHSRVRPKVTLLNYASPITPVSRPLNEMALTPLTEQEGEAYLEKCGSVRRHTVANAHSDIQLLAMATMMHSGLGEESGGEDKCLLLQPSFPPPHRQCSSEPNITDGPDEPEQGATGSQEDSELNCASLS